MRGYLKPEELTFLLAAWGIARGENPADIRRHLGTTQAACFAEAWGVLSLRPGLLGDLGLPPDVVATRSTQLRAGAQRSARLRRVTAGVLALSGAALSAWFAQQGSWTLATVPGAVAGGLATLQLLSARRWDRAFLTDDSVDLSNVLNAVGLSRRSDDTRGRLDG